MSEDGSQSIVVILLLGNPFSPAYARARAGRSDPRALDFCALNVAVYGRAGKLWALHERRIDDGDREARGVTVGTSHVRWEGDALVVDIDERTSPFGRPLRGTVTFRPRTAPCASFALDRGGLHAWWPVAPEGRIEVALERPALRFVGDGYHDANAGDVPLEASFARWTWSRARVAERRTRIAYAVVPRDPTAPPREIDFEVHNDSVQPLEGLTAAYLTPTRWRLDREARTDGSGDPRVLRELEDAPFYARALVETPLDGRRVLAVHETLSLERFERAWVLFLLQFRMRRG